MDSRGTMVSSAASAAVDGIGSRAAGRIVAIVLRQVAQQFADHAQALGVVRAR